MYISYSIKDSSRKSQDRLNHTALNPPPDLPLSEEQAEEKRLMDMLTRHDDAICLNYEDRNSDVPRNRGNPPVGSNSTSLALSRGNSDLNVSRNNHHPFGRNIRTNNKSEPSNDKTLQSAREDLARHRLLIEAVAVAKKYSEEMGGGGRGVLK